MNDRQYALYQSFVRVLAFTKEHGTDFNAASPAGQAITSLTAIVSQLRPHTDGQAGADASPATAAQEDLVDALRQDLKDIARTARAIESGTPPQIGLASRFALPDERTQRSIIAHARSVLATFPAETGLAARFIAYELPADFVADLQQDLAAWKTASRVDNSSSGSDEAPPRPTRSSPPTLGQNPDPLCASRSSAFKVCINSPVPLHPPQLS